MVPPSRAASLRRRDRPMEKRRCKRSTSAERRHVGDLAGHISVQIDRPSPSTTRPGSSASIGPIVLRTARVAERLTALAVEGRLGVDEHGGKVGEQVATAVEQPLLDQVLEAARRQRPIRLLLQLVGRARPWRGRSDADRALGPGNRSPWSTRRSRDWIPKKTNNDARRRRRQRARPGTRPAR